MDVEIREIEGFRALGMRHVGPYWQIGPVFEQLMQWCGSHQVEIGTTLGIFYDNPFVTPLAELRSDACTRIVGEPALDDSVHLVDIPGGRYAVATYRGPYSGLGEAWSKFAGEWFPANGYKMASPPPFEVYVDPHCTVPVEEMRTELYQMIE